MAFHVGQDVVCIDASVPDWQRWGSRGLTVPKKGEVYRIREIVKCSFSKQDGLQFDEIPDEWCGFIIPIWFPDRFRPLTRRSIEIVESLKAPPPADLDLEPLRPEEVAFQ